MTSAEVEAAIAVMGLSDCIYVETYLAEIKPTRVSGQLWKAHEPTGTFALMKDGSAYWKECNSDTWEQI